MRALVLALAALIAAPAQAQFNLRNLDINRVLDTAKNVGKAVTDVSEPDEIAIGRDMAARLLGAAALAADAELQR